MNDQILRHIHDELTRATSTSVTRSGSAFSLGSWTSEGRQIAVLVEETSEDGVLRLSDGGESWSELVMAGYCDPRPTAEEQAALVMVCAMHKVQWDEERAEVWAPARPDELADGVRRITAASIAIDGWRAWWSDAANQT